MSNKVKRMWTIRVINENITEQMIKEMTTLYDYCEYHFQHYLCFIADSNQQPNLLMRIFKNYIDIFL